MQMPVLPHNMNAGQPSNSSALSDSDRKRVSAPAAIQIPADIIRRRFNLNLALRIGYARCQYIRSGFQLGLHYERTPCVATKVRPDETCLAPRLAAVQRYVNPARRLHTTHCHAMNLYPTATDR